MDIKSRVKDIFLHMRQIGFFSTFNYFIQRVYKNKGTLIKLHLHGLPYPIFLRNKTYDIHIFHQIFIKKNLLFNYKKPVTTIMDCGANIGLATLYYQIKFPGVQIISIEPEQNNFNLLIKNTESYPNIIALKNGVYSKDCYLNVIDIGEGEASYRLMEGNEIGKVIETISCRSIDSLMNEFKIPKIDILKMDIEGSEKQCLLSPNIEWLKHTEYFLLEIHENIYPGLQHEILDLMPNPSKISFNGEYTLILNNEN